MGKRRPPHLSGRGSGPGGSSIWPKVGRSAEAGPGQCVLRLSNRVGANTLLRSTAIEFAVYRMSSRLLLPLPTRPAAPLIHLRVRFACEHMWRTNLRSDRFHFPLVRSFCHLSFTPKSCSNPLAWVHLPESLRF